MPGKYLQLSDEGKQFFNFLPDGIVIASPDGIVIDINKSARTLFKTTKKQAVGKALRDLLGDISAINSSSPKKSAKDVIDQILQEQEKKESVKVTVHTDSTSEITYQLKVASFTIKDKKKMIVLVIRDISKDVKSLLVQEMFIRTVGHELKQPLGLIKAYSYYLEKYFSSTNNEVQSAYVDKITTQVDIINKMFNDIVDAAKFSLTTFKISKKSISLNKFMQDFVVDMRAVNPTRPLHIMCAENVKYLDADPIRLKQALTNLVSNAIKYSPDNSKVIISVDQTKDATFISVKDEGYGIPKEHYKDIFKPYKRIKSRGKRKIRGLGLGLSFVQSIMKRHKGSVSVKSMEGKGSEFTLEFPR